MADDNLDSHKHRRKKSSGSAEWTETCFGIWTTKSKEHAGKNEEERRICRGISVLHLNKHADIKKVKKIPTQGIEIIIRDSEKRFQHLDQVRVISQQSQSSYAAVAERILEKTSAPYNIHPFLGIFTDEQEANRKAKNVESRSTDKLAGQKKTEEVDKLKDSQSDDAAPKILQRVVENWGKRCQNVGQRAVKYYNHPSSSTEILTEMKQSVTKSYHTTVRILSYCQPQEKAKQVSNFITERVRRLSKWWKE